jgi:subtilisin family serine protease
MNVRIHGWIAAVALVAGVSAAQASTPYADGQVIVRLKPGIQSQSLNKKRLASLVREVQPLVPELNLYLVKLRSKTRVMSAVEQLSLDESVQYAQPDHLVTERKADVTPNDPEFGRQWSMFNSNNRADISAPLAWRLGTGGRDTDGHELVVAVVDGGMDLNHPDLLANLWVNAGEVAGNGIDDDGNGYVDDINGWNAFQNNAAIPGSSHGTHVAGIIGARGDNGAGVTGVNWNVKIMAVAGSSGTTSVIATAYGYVMKQKQLWLDSKGAKGANVVATNSSFGVDYANCASGSYPVWNDLYNAMGQVGILSAAATANANIDVDVRGDVPTACESPYIVAVTNTNNQDLRYGQAAYGKKHVDLGAPGTAIVSTIPNNNYGPMTGTSMATPHVAGAIAFLHSVGNSEFSSLKRASPADAALALKEVLLQTVDPLPALKGITVTGGRLNLNRAAESMSTYTRE